MRVTQQPLKLDAPPLPYSSYGTLHLVFVLIWFSSSPPRVAHVLTLIEGPGVGPLDRAMSGRMSADQGRAGGVASGAKRSKAALSSATRVVPLRVVDGAASKRKRLDAENLAEPAQPVAVVAALATQLQVSAREAALMQAAAAAATAAALQLPAVPPPARVPSGPAAGTGKGKARMADGASSSGVVKERDLPRPPAAAAPLTLTGHKRGTIVEVKVAGAYGTVHL